MTGERTFKQRRSFGEWHGRKLRSCKALFIVRASLLFFIHAIVDFINSLMSEEQDPIW